MSNQARPIEILLVEDKAGDLELTQQAFAGSRIRNRLHITENGEQAIDFLKKKGAYAGAVRPDVVLLALDAQGEDGKHVLDTVRNDPELETIPIVTLTSAATQQDLVRSFRLHANCCIHTPAEMERFLEIVRAVEDFWLSVAGPRLAGMEAQR